MDISKINSSALKNILKLTEKRDALLGEIAKVENSISSFFGGKAAKGPTHGKRGRPRQASPATAVPENKRKSRRGALKDRILSALQSAGNKGIRVKDVSKQLGVKNQNVHVWFSTTGRKLDSVQKMAPGRYRLKAGA